MAVQRIHNDVRMKKWITIVDKCSKSDLPVKTCCSQNDISEQPYYYWVRKIKTQAVQKISNMEISFSLIPIQNVMRTSMMIKTGIPAPVIPHSYAYAESVAHVMKEKFVNSVPLFRQERGFKRVGLDFGRSTMSNWIIITSNDWLKSTMNRMHEELLKEHYTHTIETTIQVLREPGKGSTTKSYLWV